MTISPFKRARKYLSKKFLAGHPEFARKFLAYRLLWMLLPPALSRLLPSGSYRALISGLVVVPPGVDIPPGGVLPPGFEWPPGWMPGMPWPEGYIPPFWDLWDWEYWRETGLFCPNYLSPFGPGPGRTRPGGLSLFYFLEEWDDLADNDWTDYTEGSGQAYLVSNLLALEGIGSGDLAQVSRTETRILPPNFNVEFDLQNIAGSDPFSLWIYTGTYLTWLNFLAPDTLEYGDPDMADSITITDFNANRIDVEVLCRNTTATIRVDGSDVVTDYFLHPDTDTPGYELLKIIDESQYQIGSLLIEEP